MREFHELPEWLQREVEAEIQADRRAMFGSLAMMGTALLLLAVTALGLAWFGGAV